MLTIGICLDSVLLDGTVLIKGCHFARLDKVGASSSSFFCYYRFAQVSSIIDVCTVRLQDQYPANLHRKSSKKQGREVWQVCVTANPILPSSQCVTSGSSIQADDPDVKRMLETLQHEEEEERGETASEHPGETEEEAQARAAERTADTQLRRRLAKIEANKTHQPKQKSVSELAYRI